MCGTNELHITIEEVRKILALDEHIAEDDPHEGYQKETEKDVAGGYAGLNGSGYVAPGYLGSGATSLKFLRGDSTWQTIDAISGNAWSVLTDGDSNIIFADGDVVMTETIRT